MFPVSSTSTSVSTKVPVIQINLVNLQQQTSISADPPILTAITTCSIPVSIRGSFGGLGYIGTSSSNTPKFTSTVHTLTLDSTNSPHHTSHSGNNSSVQLKSVIGFQTRQSFSNNSLKSSISLTPIVTVDEQTLLPSVVSASILR